MAAYAGIIPMVTGGPSEVLDQGRLTRLFTPAQKVAIAEPDCGCAFPACSRPSSRGSESRQPVAPRQWAHRPVEWDVSMRLPPSREAQGTMGGEDDWRSSVVRAAVSCRRPEADPSG